MCPTIIFLLAFYCQPVLALPEPNTAEILNPTNAHQIMFAPVGTYATYTASLHVKITINADEYLDPSMNISGYFTSTSTTNLTTMLLWLLKTSLPMPQEVL